MAAAAAIRPMMALAREEAAIVSSEATMAARSTVATEAAAAVRATGKEVLNPLALREAAESRAKQAVSQTESSVFAALGKAPGVSTPTMTTSTSSVSNTVLTETGAELANITSTASTSVETSVVGQVLEHDMGLTVREAMTNAGETGAQEVLMQAQEVVATMVEGKHGQQAVAAAQAAQQT